MMRVMSKRPHRILVVLGHPDPAGGHLCHALADAYAEGARAGGHEVHVLDVAQLDFPLLRSARDWQQGPAPPSLAPAQQEILWSDHLVIVFPLWMGDMPALLKAFLEQVARPGFAFHQSEGNPFGRKALGGRSARVIVTMGMPALVYRYLYRAHSVRSLERNILGFVGIAPVRETLIGMVEGLGEPGVAKWLRRVREMGVEGS
jgi:putative NADPH-quinone reductase